MKYNKLSKLNILILVSISIILISGCIAEKDGEELIIFHAGSLTVPIHRVIAEFEKIHSDVKIISEAAGSRTCARKISDLKRKCDIFASADYSVIDNLLIPRYADWSIKFATNRMCIAFTEKSNRENEMNDGNWFDILLDKNVHFGRSDPNSDPCGYRTVMVVKLAEKYYRRDGLADELLHKDLKYIRPKETDLLALLETGEIDYMFIYRSVAMQHKLKYIDLPDEINLGNFKFENLYRKVSVKITGKKPGEYIVRRGAPMVYGLTIPKNAPNKKLAIEFLKFMLGGKGLSIIEQNGQKTIVPSVATGYDKIPDELKKFAIEPNIDAKE